MRTGGLGVLPGGALAAGCELFVRHVTPVTNKRNVLVENLLRSTRNSALEAAKKCAGTISRANETTQASQQGAEQTGAVRLTISVFWPVFFL